MIKYTYTHHREENFTLLRLFLCFIVFMDLTVFFMLTFINICFQTFVSNPPIQLIVILYSIMGLDLAAHLYLERRYTLALLVNSIIFILLIFEWTIKNKYLVFLSSVVYLRFPELFDFNQLVLLKIGKNRILMVIFTLLKIFYGFLFLGHFCACIFYAIDDILLTSQYYGNFKQDPVLYFQGQQMAFTPIRKLDQYKRYIYSVYYIYSMFTFVAFGDVIPKNPHQTSYTCIIKIMSIVSIPLLLEQTLIVLRENTLKKGEIINQLKYVDQMMEETPNINFSKKQKILGFLFYTLNYEMSYDPKISSYSSHFQYALISGSIQSRGELRYLSDRQKEKIPQNMQSFLGEYLLLNLQLKLVSPGQFILDNLEEKQLPNLIINISGKMKSGYEKIFLAKRFIKDQKFLIGWRQFLFNNKTLHKGFVIQTCQLCQVYVLFQQNLQAALSLERKNMQGYSPLIQQFERSKQIQLGLILKEKGILPSSLSEDVTPTEQVSMILQQMPCWVCNGKHLPAVCPDLHYQENMGEVIKRDKRRSQRKHYKRSEKNKRKCVNMSKTMISMVKESLKKEEMFQRALSQYVERKKVEISFFEAQILRNKVPQFEQYQPYSIFYPQFNLSECIID